MTTSRGVRQELEKTKVDHDSQQHNFSVHQEPANVVDTSGQFENSQPPGDKAQISYKVKVKCNCNTSKGKNVSDGVNGSKSKDRPIQAVEASLRRWLVHLEDHELRASYADLVPLHASAKRFMDLVDFYFLTLIDLLMKRSQLFQNSDITVNDGIPFPPTSTLKLVATERSKVDISYPRYRSQSRGCSSSHVQQARTSNERMVGDAVRRELHVLQDWLRDGIDYLENEPIKVYYEDFRALQATTKRLVELVDSYFKDLVETLLERCVLRAENE